MWKVFKWLNFSAQLHLKQQDTQMWSAEKENEALKNTNLGIKMYNFYRKMIWVSLQPKIKLSTGSWMTNKHSLTLRDPFLTSY